MTDCNGSHDDMASQVLGLNGSDITSLSPHLLSSTKYTEVNLDYNDITSIPDDVCKGIQYAAKVSAVGNCLQTLPNEISECVRMRELYLNENELNALPDAITNCKQLSILNIVGNVIKHLPENIGKLKNLTELYGDENELEALPDSLGSLINLRIAEFSANVIYKLPSDLSGLQCLSVLNLSENRLTFLPDSLGDLPSLTVLDLSSNSLKTLPGRFASHKCIQKLYAESNLLDTLPDWFGELPEIQVLSVRDNQLVQRPLVDQFGTTSDKLTKLDMAGNFITDLPEQLEGLSSLKELHLGSVIRELERRNFQNGNWICRIPDSITSLVQLQRINLEENQLSDLPQEIGNLVNLQFIDLGQNKLRELPDSFCDLRSLQTCQISKNHLQVLPARFGNLQSLVDLRLDSNLLEELPDSMTSLTQLRTLDLFNNRLSHLPSCLEAFTNLVSLDLAQNDIPLHHLKVPKVASSITYAPRDPALKNTWRGRPRQNEVNNEDDTSVPVYGEGDIPDEPEPYPEESGFSESVLERAMRRNLSLWRSHSDNPKSQREGFGQNVDMNSVPMTAVIGCEQWQDAEEPESTEPSPNQSTGIATILNGTVAPDHSHMSQNSQQRSPGEPEDWDAECAQSVYPIGGVIPNSHTLIGYDASHVFVPGNRHPINRMVQKETAEAEEGQFDDDDV